MYVTVRPVGWRKRLLLIAICLKLKSDIQDPRQTSIPQILTVVRLTEHECWCGPNKPQTTGCPPPCPALAPTRISEDWPLHSLLSRLIPLLSPRGLNLTKTHHVSCRSSARHCKRQLTGTTPTPHPTVFVGGGGGRQGTCEPYKNVPGQIRRSMQSTPDRWRWQAIRPGSLWLAPLNMSAFLCQFRNLPYYWPVQGWSLPIMENQRPSGDHSHPLTVNVIPLIPVYGHVWNRLSFPAVGCRHPVKPILWSDLATRPFGTETCCPAYTNCSTQRRTEWPTKVPSSNFMNQWL